MISLSSETSVERSNSSSLDVHDDIIHPFLIYLKSLSVIDLFPVAQINISEVSSNFRFDIFDNIKKYKLASSEGLNKQINRMIRFNTLKNFLFNGDSEYINSQKSLFKKMEDKLQKNLIETIENSLNQIEEDN